MTLNANSDEVMRKRMECQVRFEPVQSIQVKLYDGEVYNLQTEAEEYIAEGIVVHNCPHLWETRPGKVAKRECPNLWMGE